MSIFISNGNSKLKCNIFDLPCIKTCKPNLTCHKYCYAKKSLRYPAVGPCRERNLKATKLKSFVKDMIQALSKKRNNIVRIHSSGDFYSVGYIKKWFEIMRSMPDKKFYAYTKRDDLFTKKMLLDKPDNFTLIFSFDGIKDSDDIETLKIHKFDKIAVVHKTKSNCPAQLDSKIKCGVECIKCIDKKGDKVIIFKKH